MANWRCPHCGTPQPEASRCWVCSRSSTCCATCRHYRRGVATDLGVCALDPRRAAIHAGDIRPCWEARVTPPAREGLFTLVPPRR